MFAIFITRQLTGNIKESIIPYVVANVKQLRVIDKSKKEDLSSEPNQNIFKIIEKLQRYSKNYVNIEAQLNSSLNSNSWSKRVNVERSDSNSSTNTDSSENGAETQPDQNELSQPEVESLMPQVRYHFFAYFSSLNSIKL